MVVLFDAVACQLSILQSFLFAILLRALTIEGEDSNLSIVRGSGQLFKSSKRNDKKP